jgi:hypothetical protein
MFCVPKSPAIKRYTSRFTVVMVVYVVFILLVAWAFKSYHPKGLIAYALAVLPALPIIGMLVVVGLYLAEEKDEFIRNLQVQSMLWGIGGTLAVTTVWGFLEDFAHVPHMDLFLVFPIFWFFVGVSTPIVRRRYR